MFINSSPIEELVRYIIKGSYLNNTDNQFWHYAYWTEIPDNNPYPIISVQSVGGFLDANPDKCSDTVLIDIMDLKPEPDICKDHIDFISELPRIVQLHKHTLMQIKNYLIGIKKFPDGSKITPFSVSRQASINVYYLGIQDLLYGIRGVRPTDAQLSIPDNLFIVRLTLTINGPCNILCCDPLTPSSEILNLAFNKKLVN